MNMNMIWMKIMKRISSLNIYCDELKLTSGLWYLFIVTENMNQNDIVYVNYTV